jgi:MerR family transcriptional regulator/heat shock protein HspR
MMSAQDIPTKLADKERGVYTIGVAADLVGVSVHTLRMYESEGLILPDRTSTKRRLYSHMDIERLRCIRLAIEEQGLNLAGIKAVMAMIPCWDLKGCTPADQAACDAFTKLDGPCWSVSKIGPYCQQLDCRTCEVYRQASTCHNMKAFLKENWKSA